MALSGVTIERRRMLQEYFRTPHTVSEAHLDVHLPLSTVRREVREMKKAGMLAHTGNSSGHEPYYTTTTVVNIPHIYLESIQRHTSTVEIARNAGTNADLITQGMRAAYFTQEIFVNLLMWAKYLAENPGANVDEDLKKVRLDARTAVRLLLSNAKVLEQALGQPVWWSTAGLRTLTDDPDIDWSEVQDWSDNIAEAKKKWSK